MTGNYVYNAGIIIYNIIIMLEIDLLFPTIHQ